MIYPNIIARKLFCQYRHSPSFAFGKCYRYSSVKDVEKTDFPPNAVDVLVTDIDDNDLRVISSFFKFERLAPTSDQPKLPLRGKLFGRNKRIFSL